MTYKLTDKGWQSLTYGSIFEFLNDERRDSILNEMKSMDESEITKIIQIGFRGCNDQYKEK